jgi:LysM repeat protein
LIRLELGTRVRAGLGLVCLAVSVGLFGGYASAQSLRGSRGALDLQTAQAVSHDFTYLGEPGQVHRFVAAGYLVPVDSNRDYRLKDVSFPVARPEVRLFIARLASQYRRACGERLVVTSLTRPLSHQPRNASDRSVHPTGMALDLRRPAGRCRRWLERTLLSLESRGVLEATAERHPPHYHVAVFPEQYAFYVGRLTGLGSSGSPVSLGSYTVRRGDTLWQIARRYDISLRALRQVNKLSSTRIRPGQRLTLP